VASIVKSSLVTVGLVLSLLLAGCGSSSEISPQEKRNNYDKCVLDYIAEHPAPFNPALQEAYKKQGELDCRNLLG
jgi:ABC-type oligopeptide transport system substrate-binding subunit